MFQMLQHNITDILSRYKSTKFHSFWIKNNDYMHNFKYEKIANLYPTGYISSISLYVLYISGRL